MSEEQYAQVREVPNCGGADKNCQECCNIAKNSVCRTRYGMRPPFLPENVFNAQCECHDICVKEVKYICPKDISCEVRFPPIGTCRRAPNSPQGIPVPGKCNVYVACASERLLPNCRGVAIDVDLLIVCPTEGSDPDLIMPVRIRKECDAFFPFPPEDNCTNPMASPVTGEALQKALQEIDGSCLTIQAYAEVLPADTLTQARLKLTGKIIDKLWKFENLWVSAIRPYALTPQQVEEKNIRNLTVCREFDTMSHDIPECVPNGYVPCR